MKESMAVEKERVALKELYLPKFQKAVPAMKAVRYFQIENKIQAVVNTNWPTAFPWWNSVRSYSAGAMFLHRLLDHFDGGGCL